MFTVHCEEGTITTRRLGGWIVCLWLIPDVSIHMLPNYLQECPRRTGCPYPGYPERLMVVALGGSRGRGFTEYEACARGPGVEVS